MTAALLDTSVFVALEAGRRIDAAALPGRAVISVVTSAELHAGVMIAEDERVRELRLGTLGMAQVLELVPIDEVVPDPGRGFVAPSGNEGARCT